MTRSFAAALPHGPLTEVVPGVYLVTGTFHVDPLGLLAFPRNMTVLRRGNELTLLNAVRLDAEGERALATLGEVRHVVRLGAFHGTDDPYYLARYAPLFWHPPGARNLPTGGHTHEMLVDGEAPAFAPDARVFVFRDTQHAEAAVRLPHGNGLLAVCDSITNVESAAGFSRLLRWMTPRAPVAPCGMGSDVWRKRMQKRGGPTLQAEFERLLTLDFDGVLPAHGAAMVYGATAALRSSMGALWNNGTRARFAKPASTE